MHIDTSSALNQFLPIRHAPMRGHANHASTAVREPAGSLGTAGIGATREADVDLLTRGVADHTISTCSMPDVGAGSGKGHGLPNLSNTDSPEASMTASERDVTQAPPADPSQGDPTPPSALDTILEIVSAWDTKNPEFDYTGDGVVNIHDLLLFIRSQNPISCPGPESDRQVTGIHETLDTSTEMAATTAAVGDAPVPPPSSDNGISLASEGIKWKFAADDSRVISSHESAGRPSAVRQIEVRAQKLVDTLISRLDENGFDSQPPTNLRDLVQQLNLKPGHMNFVMHKLGQHYPMGLGVNLRA